ncbi:MAG: MATE family efflux transporter [Lachnospiraceae bacterium]
METTKKVSLTQGPIWKGLLYFAFPLFLGNLFQQLYNTVDSLIVGNLIGSDALAAVSSSGSVIFLLVGFFNGIAVGSGVIISKHFGAKEYDKVQKAIHTNLAFGIVSGILLTIIGVVLTPQILRWMGTPPSVLPNSIIYFRIYFMGALALVLYNTLTGTLQAVGDSRHPLYYLIVSSILNVVLDLLFIGVFHFGVGSAALATVISQALSVVLCLYRLMYYDTPYKVSLKKIRFDTKILKQIIELGLPAGGQNSIISIANIVVQSNINAFGVTAVAGCGAYSKLDGFGFLPITCFAMALTTFIGQNLGARNFKRAKKGAVYGIFCSIILAEIVGIVMRIFAPHLIAAFNNDPSVVAYGVQQVQTITLFYFLLAFSHCAAGILRGAGKSIIPMLVMLICWCVIRVTYITITVHFIPKIQVIFWAYPITWTLSTILFIVYLVKADWVHSFEKKKI